MVRKDRDAPRMTKLAQLVQAKMDEEGWTPIDVENRGMVHSTLSTVLNRRTPYKTGAREGTLLALHASMGIPMRALRQAEIRSHVNSDDDEQFSEEADGVCITVASLMSMSARERKREIARLRDILEEVDPS